MMGRINKLETFGSVDGPGVRFVVFTQGCPMRCQFCHNPETWDFKGTAAGAFDISAEDLLKKALRYKSYWGTEGGITVSGGEPLMQMDFLLEFFELAKEAGVHTCIDTSGVNFVRTEPYFGKFQRLMEVTDLLLVDLKIMDPGLHKQLTGHPIDHNLDMFRYLDEIHKPIWIRHVLVPGISDNDQLLEAASNFIGTLSNVKKVEVLPYHSLALAKYKEMGIDYPLADTKSPSPERVQNANRILKTESYR
jgi:pyruvate formate lyase activating enzyme